MSFFDQNFLLCPGVEKCGTTSLHALLAGQSGFVVPTRKELFFFNGDFDKGEDFYKAHFNGAARAEAQSWFVDITPSYCRRAKTLDRVKQALTGEVRVLFLIRNPVKRAFSFYWHDMVRHFLRGEKGANNFEQFVNCSFQHFYQQRAAYYFTPYYEMLRSWMEAFPGRCSVHVTEETVIDPAPLIYAINRLCNTHLNLKSAFPRENSAWPETLSIFPDGVRRYTGQGVKTMLMNRERAVNAMAMQGSFTHFVPRAEAEAMHQTLFADDIKKCEDLLGRDLSVLTEQTDLVSPVVKTYARGNR